MVDDAAFRVVDVTSAPASWAMTQYVDELAWRFPEGFDTVAAFAEAPATLNAPAGLFVVAGTGETPTACGGVHWIDDERAEVKRMWVAPASRGKGVASALLTFLEGLVGESGRDTVVLDTNSVLTDAVALYQRRGYRPIPRYNDNPYAHHWFAKSLEPA